MFLDNLVFKGMMALESSNAMLAATTDGDGLQKFVDSLLNIATWLKPLNKPLAIFGFIAVGICLAIPIESFHQKAIKILPAVAIGLGMFMFAVELGSSFTSNFK